MIIAAYVIGAARAFIYIRGEYDFQATRLEEAVEEARAAGYLGDGILGSDHDLTLWVHRGAGAYICGEEYAKLGAPGSTGTKLVSVSGNVQNPGNFEIELGTTSRDIIYGLAGGPPEGREVKFWFPGGSSSPVLTADDLDLASDFDTMAQAGSMLGSGAN